MNCGLWWLVVVVGSSCRLNEITFYETIPFWLMIVRSSCSSSNIVELDREIRCRVCHDELALLLLEDDDSDLPWCTDETIGRVPITWAVASIFSDHAVVVPTIVEERRKSVVTVIFCWRQIEFKCFLLLNRRSWYELHTSNTNLDITIWVKNVCQSGCEYLT